MSLTSTEWVIAGATLVGPILAVQAQKWVERARARRARKANVFGIRPGRSCAPGYSVPNLEGSFGMGVKTPAVRMTRPRHISKTARQTGIDPLQPLRVACQRQQCRGSGRSVALINWRFRPTPVGRGQL